MYTFIHQVSVGPAYGRRRCTDRTSTERVRRRPPAEYWRTYDDTIRHTVPDTWPCPSLRSNERRSCDRNRRAEGRAQTAVRSAAPAVPASPAPAPGRDWVCRCGSSGWGDCGGGGRRRQCRWGCGPEPGPWRRRWRRRRSRTRCPASDSSCWASSADRRRCGPDIRCSWSCEFPVWTTMYRPINYRRRSRPASPCGSPAPHTSSDPPRCGWSGSSVCRPCWSSALRPIRRWRERRCRWIDAVAESALRWCESIPATFGDRSVRFRRRWALARVADRAPPRLPRPFCACAGAAPYSCASCDDDDDAPPATATTTNRLNIPLLCKTMKKKSR